MKLWVLTPYKPDRASHACDPSTWGMEAGETETQGHLQLHKELVVSPGYIRLCLKSKQNQTKKSDQKSMEVAASQLDLDGQMGPLCMEVAKKTLK